MSTVTRQIPVRQSSPRSGQPTGFRIGQPAGFTGLGQGHRPGSRLLRIQTLVESDQPAVSPRSPVVVIGQGQDQSWRSGPRSVGPSKFDRPGRSPVSGQPIGVDRPGRTPVSSQPVGIDRSGSTSSGG